jgi:hypothetical protein
VVQGYGWEASALTVEEGRQAPGGAVVEVEAPLREEDLQKLAV